MNYQALTEIAKRLQTQGGVTQAIETYERTARSVGALKMDDEPKAALVGAVERGLAALRELAQALKGGDYIVVDPDLSGWRYVTCHFLPDTGLKEYVRGHENINTVIALAEQLGQPVVVGSEHPEAWREQNSEYATVAMRFALTDVKVEKATGRVVEGDQSRIEEATELWTFVRRAGDNPEGWRLSAIQQA